LAPTAVLDVPFVVADMADGVEGQAGRTQGLESCASVAEVEVLSATSSWIWVLTVRQARAVKRRDLGGGRGSSGAGGDSCASFHLIEKETLPGDGIEVGLLRTFVLRRLVVPTPPKVLTAALPVHGIGQILTVERAILDVFLILALTT
jgi:hypothetical protein